MWAWQLPIGYCLPLLHYPTIAMSRIKSFFKIESEMIKDDMRKLLFSRQKSLISNPLGVILLQFIMYN